MLISMLTVCRETKAYEFETICGLTANTVSTCHVKKGDAVLDGEVGLLYTYHLQSGDKIEVFQPDRGSGVCSGNNKVRKNLQYWFPTSRVCKGDWIEEVLQSGNTIFVTVADSY